MFGKLKRMASHAGTWYHADKKTLNTQLDNYMEEAKKDKEKNSKDKKSQGKIRAIIGPHAGLEYSGRVAAYAYSEINPKLYKRVILLGPSHYVYLDQCALTMCSVYQTPIGDINIDNILNE